MARWTESYEDIKRLVENQKKLPISGIVKLTLVDGSSIEGVIRRVNCGNNAGKVLTGKGFWSYYGELEIETKDSSRYVVDFLDIESGIDIWESRKDEFEKLGLIKIVDFPTK